MDITIHRKDGFFANALGRNGLLAILADGVVVGRLATGETLNLSLPDVAGNLQVALLGDPRPPYTGNAPHELFSISKGFAIFPNQAVQAFTVRTRDWVVFDVLDLGYVPPLSRWVFVLEAQKGQT